MAVGPQGVVTFVGTRKEMVYSVTDRNKDRVADDVKVFAPSIKMAVPNGVCFSKDGHLYLAEQNRVLWFPAAEFFYEGPDVAAFAIVKQGKLDPGFRRELSIIPPAPAVLGRMAASTLRSASPSTCRRRKSSRSSSDWALAASSA